MSNIYKKINWKAIPLLLVFMIFSDANAQTINTKYLPKQIVHLSDSIVRSYPEFKGALFITKKDKVIFEYDNANDSLINIASLTKKITALAILRLVNAKKLSLHQNLKTIFENVPEDKSQITIHQLLTHTAGFPQNYVADGITDKYVALSEFLKQPLKFEPGDNFSYSDDGYNILAIIIEEVTNENYEHFVRKEILMPLHMNDTYFWGEAGLLMDKKMASRLGTIDASMVKRNWGYMGALGIYSNSKDLLKLSRTFPHSVEMDIPSDNYRKFIGYGEYGNFKNNFKRIWNDGDEDWGHGAIVLCLPDYELKIVAISNSGNLGFYHITDVLANKVVDSLTHPNE